MQVFYNILDDIKYTEQRHAAIQEAGSRKYGIHERDTLETGNETTP